MTTQKELKQTMESMYGGEQIEVKLSEKYENKTLFIRCYDQSVKWGNSYALHNDSTYRNESVNIDKVTTKSLHVYTLDIFDRLVRNIISLKDITIVSVEYH
jgi:hypothetical protein